MATTTTNYGLKKPESTDLVSVVPFNENFDTIDSTIKSLSDTTSTSLGTKITNDGGVTKVRVLTQSEYDAISSKDSTTVYFVKS